MKPRYIFLIAITLHILSCGEPLVEIDAVPPVSLSTGEVNLTTLTATGEIEGVGDGIIQHGHVWSSATNMPTVNDSRTELGGKSEGGEFVSQLNFPETNKKYFIRGYAKDVHDCIYYGETAEVIVGNPVIADFSVESNDCFAACNVKFTNSSSNYDKYYWDFGDGSPIDSVNRDPSHQYQLPGTYRVVLTVSGPGGVDTDSMNVTIRIRTFAKTFPGFGPGVKVICLPGGGYLIAGNKINPGSGKSDVYLIKTDAAGNTEEDGFEEIYGKSDFDIATDMIRLSDGSIVVVGYGNDENEEERDILYLRTKADGQPITGPLMLNISDAANFDDQAFGVVETQDKNLLIVGSGAMVNGTGARDVFIFKTPPDLNTNLGFFRHEYSGSETVGKIILSVNNLIISGSIASGSTQNMFFLKADNQGIISNDLQEFGGAGADFAHSVKELPTGEFLIAGYSFQSGNGNINIVKTSSSGVPIGSPFIYGGPLFEIAYDLEIGNDGSMVLTGSREDIPFLVKLNSNGQELWARTFGGNGQFNCLAPTPDGGFITVGINGNDLFLVKTDQNGMVQ